MYSGFSVPPAGARVGLVIAPRGAMCAGGVLGLCWDVGGVVQSVLVRQRVGKRAVEWRTVGAGDRLRLNRRTCRSDRNRKGSARARQRLGGGWQDASGLADPSPHPLPPAPPRVRFAEFRLVFLVSVGQEERSMSIFIPGRAPPLPTSHRPPPQHRSRRPVHRVAHAPSREASKHADGWRSWSYLSTLKLAKKTPLISPVTSSPPPLVSKVGSHLHSRAALVGEHAAGGRRSRELGGWRAQVGDDRAI